MEKAGATLHLTEIKATATFRKRLASNLRTVAKAAGPETAVKMQVIYGGTEPMEVDEVRFVPWHEG